ncbi:hypothetical protein ACFOY2_26010 [Nonomuraea purpurea]|uniref:Uncharacterized protein n=1 Tax=Nonomuraea purpurea TaxID=1849276 RepID=A0ABV8GF10_9ACTN
MRAEKPPPLHRLLAAKLRQAAQRTPTTVLPAGFPDRAGWTARLICRHETQNPPASDRPPPLAPYFVPRDALVERLCGTLTSGQRFSQAVLFG